MDILTFSARGRRLLPWAGLVLGLLVTLIAWQGLRNAEHLRLSELKRVRADATAERIERRMKSLKQVLRGATGFLSRGTLPSRQEWKAYVEDLELPGIYPGIQGLGFAQWIPAGSLGAHEQRLKAEGFPGYRVLPGGALPADPDGCSAIIYLEPMDDRNQRAFGMDMWAEADRREAMARARDTGLPTLSGPVTLFQEKATGIQTGTLLYAPAYRQDQPTDTVAQRRRALLGWAYYPLRMNDLMQATLEERLAHGHLQLFDGADFKSSSLLFDSDPGIHEVDSHPFLDRSMEVDGRIWSARFWVNPAFLSASGQRSRWEVLAGGTVISLLFFGLAGSLARSRDRAEAAAARKEKELMASEAQFHLLFQRAPIGMTIVDSLSGRFLVVNPKLEQILGYTGAELQQRTFSSVTHPDHVEASLAAVAQLASGELQAVQKEKRYLHRDGHEVWARLQMVKLLGVAGDPPRHLSLVEDITDMKRQAQSLADSAAFLRSLLDAIPANIAVLDERGTITEVNRNWDAFARANGGTTGPGANYLEAVGSAESPEAEAIRNGIREVIEGRIPLFTCDYPCDTPERPHWFQLLAAPISGHSGGLVVHLDVTSLKEAEFRFRAVVEHSPIGIAQSGTDGRILAANPAFLNLLGARPDQVVGELFGKFTHPDRRAQDLALHLQLMDGSRDLIQAQTRWLRPDGSELDVDLSVSVVRDEHGRIMFVYGMARDVSEELRAQKALAASEKRFRTLFRLLPVGVTLTDPAGQIIQSNPASEVLLGLASSDLLGREFKGGYWDIIRPDGSPMPVEEFASVRALQERQRVDDVEMGVRRPDGTVSWILVSAEPVLDADIGVLIVYSDITARRRTEQELRDREARYLGLFELSPDGVSITRLRDGALVEVNNAWEEMFGHAREEALGRTTGELGFYSNPDDRMALFARLPEHGSVPIFNLELRRKDGSTFVAELNSRVMDLGGERCLVAVLRDVTVEAVLNRTLQESESRFRRLADEAPVLIWIAGEDEACTWFNRTWQDWTGRSLEQELGSGWTEGIHPEDHGRCLLHYEQQFEARQPFEMEFRLRHRSGEYRWLRDHGTPRYDGAGAFLGFIGACSDIQDAKEATAALEIAEARWNFALEGVGDGVWDWNAATNEVFYSRRWKAMLGFEEHEIGRQRSEWDSRVHPDDKSEVDRAVADYLGNATPAYAHEYRMRCKDGKYKWILDRGRIVQRSPEGKPLRLIGTHTDLTEHKRVEEAETRALKAESLVLMAGSIAHDFNNLFQALMACLELVELKSKDSPEALRPLGSAKDVLRRAVTLSWKMLDFSGRAISRLQPLDLPDLVDRWAAGLEQPLPAGRRLELDLKRVPTINADPDKLHKILDAIFVNALEAMDEAGQLEGRVGIRVYADFSTDRPATHPEGVWAAEPPPGPATVCLEIANDGPIPGPEVLSRMFDPFFTTRKLGRGLGLASALGLLQAHRAGVHVFSDAEGGLVFRIHFPPAGV